MRAVSAPALLGAALENPFWIYDPRTKVNTTAILDWLKWLRAHYPLLCLDANSYARLNPGGLSTHPLSLCIDCIKRDERIAEGTMQWGLAHELEERRLHLPEGRTLSAINITESDPTRYLRGGGTSVLRFLSTLPIEIDYTDGDPDGSHSPYEVVGEEIVALIDEIKAAESKAARQAATARLTGYLASMGVPGRGRPRKGPPEEILEKLNDEIRGIVELVVTVGDKTVSPEARAIIAANDVSVSAQSLWPVRLTLPVLSQVELLAIRHRRDITPRRLAVWLLARRLRLSPASVARSVLGNAAVAQFKGRNPVNAFLSVQGE